jgi:hypothetical protein
MAPAVVETAWFVVDRLGPERQAAFLYVVTSTGVDLVDLTTEDRARVIDTVE